jgi:hypothetical protein
MSTLDIPLLTEVLPAEPPPLPEESFPEIPLLEPEALPVATAAPVAEAVAEPAAARAAIAVNPIKDPVAEPVYLTGDWANEEWERLEQGIQERVTHQVLAQLDDALEHGVRDSLTRVLQTAVESLAAEIRIGLQHTLEEVIARTVAQEIAKLQEASQ